MAPVRGSRNGFSAARYNGVMWRANSRLRRVARDYAISIAFWLVTSLLAGLQTYGLELRAHLPVKLNDVLLLFAARYLSVALLTPPIFYVVNRWPVTGSLVRRTNGYALGYVPFAVAFGSIRWTILPPWMEQNNSWGPRALGTLFELIYASFVDVALLYLGVVIAAHAYTYFVRGQRQEIERLQLRQSLAQSELQTLRAQLHPHFLFNTLQGVSTLIDTDRATALIPQLLLQPLIENAVVHGIAATGDDGWIEIEARLQQMQLLVTIRNSI